MQATASSIILESRTGQYIVRVKCRPMMLYRLSVCTDSVYGADWIELTVCLHRALTELEQAALRKTGTVANYGHDHAFLLAATRKPGRSGGVTRACSACPNRLSSLSRSCVKYITILVM